MAVDLSVFDKLNTVSDYQKADEEDQLRKQLQRAQIRQALQKENTFDLDKLGEQVLFKAASGMPLSPQEQAVGRAYDAKRQQVYMDETGNVVRKPPAFGSLAGETSRAPQKNPHNAVSYGPLDSVSEDLALDDMMGDYAPPGSPPRSTPMKPGDFTPTSGKADPLKEAFEREMAAAAGNPKLQQNIREFYAKKRLDLDFAEESGTFNENQSNAAGFADRMHLSNPVISDPVNIAAGADPSNKFLEKIPLLGNYALPEEYQLYNQGKLDFITAVLRKESGAAIGQDEYTREDQKYFPQPGDKPEAIAQKNALRQAAIDAMTRSAGPAYKAPPPAPKRFRQGKTKVPKPAIEELFADPSSAAEFDQTFGVGAAAYYLGGRK